MGMDYYEIVDGPAELPITLDEAKAACRITHDAEDVLISALIGAATFKLEDYTNLCFVERSYLGFFEGLACSKFEKGLFLTTRRAPLIQVDSVNVTENSLQTLVGADQYNIKKTAGFPRIVFNGEGSYFPDLIPYPWQVEFQAGFGDAAAVPETIKMMIKQFVCFLYGNRGDCGDAPAMPDVVKMMADEWRIVNTYG